MTGISHPILLLGVGTAGAKIAHGVSRAFGDGMRCVLVDTDASSSVEGADFILLGGDRLAGRGALRQKIRFKPLTRRLKVSASPSSSLLSAAVLAEELR